MASPRLILDLRDLANQMRMGPTISGKPYHAYQGLATALELIAEHLASGLDFDAQEAAEQILEAAGLTWWLNEV